jgi:N-acyl-D-amino-acid deacylase
VCPGFIDTHVHSDLLCTKPEIHQIKLKQGVTTELLGQDGISVAPVSSSTKELWQKQLKGLNGDIGDWKWFSVSEYLQFLQKSNPLGNVSYLVPHGNVRTLVMGFDNREANYEEMTAMRKHVENALDEGAVGFSSGLVYPPNVFSNTQELIEICKGVAQYDGCFVVHMRNESFNIMGALDEMFEVAKQSGVRLHISHLKVIGTRNRHFYPRILEKMEEARSQGIEVTFDQYPYTAGSTVFHAILPPWMHDGGTEKMIERLGDQEIRKRLKEELAESTTYENWVFNCGWDNIIVASVGTKENKQYEGKSVDEISRLRKQSPSDTAFDLLIEEEGNVSMVIHWGLEEDMTKAMKSPYHIVGSDSIFGGKPHPRLSGTQPRILSRYVREQGVLRLEEAIHHMTGAPAQLLRLQDRGIIKEGNWADIVILNSETIKDEATFDDPTRDPSGINFVIVNGEICVENGTTSLQGNGRVLASPLGVSNL